jgi:beta-glucosidase
MKPTTLKFPDNFYWGSATSAHQVEGNNHNDWSEWEKGNAERLASVAKDKWQNWQVKKFPEMLKPENYISGSACDHYNRYEEDFNIAKSMSHNAHHFSIEWSRIEPQEGKFDEKEIEHYRKVLKALRKRGLEPFVTLWHWTNPLWLAKLGGPASSKFPFYFSRYVKRVLKNLNNQVKFWITVNEPTSVISNAFLRGNWPPQKKSIGAVLKVYKIIARAHQEAYEHIHENYPKNLVGFCNLMNFVEPKYYLCPFDQIVSRLYRHYSNEKIYTLTKNKFDFIGLNYYFHNKIRFTLSNKNEKKEVSDLGWEIFPEGIYHVLKEVKKYNLPIYVTENGLADGKDKKRARFIKDHLYWVHKAIAEGIDVRGYFYWSLLDNFEWDKGYWPRFGLVSVDRKTMKRTIRPSAREYAKICKSNTLNFKF